ncbi:glycosyl hydrolase family 8 [Kocuria oceani]|uniref:Glycosyl hydrolase family 8 n=1 Tax=Kocuria oceani TaxID=988827 RepID=A0ABV9TG86_9MICC|nr:glycosyl hydrolase family 8 [Kocuria oceani]
MHRRTLLATGAALAVGPAVAAPIPALGATTVLRPTTSQRRTDASVRALWHSWTALLRHDAARGWWAVRADAQGGANAYVAEGQGYGLMLCAQLAPADPRARTYAEGITRYVLDHPSRIDPGLHAAEQDHRMVTQHGGDSATDGDLDIAMGWLMAHRRWGSAGTYDYLRLARDRIAAVKRSLVSPTTGLLELGDWSHGAWQNVSRPSDWMIGHFGAFHRATGDASWGTVWARHLAAIRRLQSVHAPRTGLLPDFTVGPPASIAPAPAHTLESAHDGHCYYNSCRVPLRLGSSRHPEARAAAARISRWARTKCGGDPARLPTGYTLGGATLPGGAYQDLAFIAPLAVGARWGGDQAWLDALWRHLAARTQLNGYYASSLQLLSMVQVSGTYALSP